MHYRISEASNILNIKPSTLHYYERVGILTNISKNTSGHRIYTEDDIAFLKIIRCMRHTGMKIGDIKNYVALFQQGDDTLSTRHAIFVKQKQQLVKQMLDIKAYLTYVDEKINYYEQKIEKQI